MIDLLVPSLTVYGPLGLGWVAAIFLFARLTKTHDLVIKALTDNTRAITLLAERIRTRDVE